MAFVIGHSQTKYLCEYLCPGAFTVFSYPGAQTMDFVTKEEIFEVVPFFSRVVLVVGANDIGRKTPDQIVEEIELLCEQIKIASPSAIVWVSAVLPRVQNSFHSCQMNLTYLQRWNQDAIEINIKLRQLSSRTPWLDIIEHPDFHSLFGGNRQLIGRDGLHLNSDGHEALARDIEVSIQHFGAQTTQPVVVPDKRQETLSLFVGPQRYSDVIRSKVRSKVTGSPAVSRSKVTGSPAVSRSKVTRSPAVSRSKVTGSPAISRSKVKGSPAVGRSEVTGSPAVSRSKVTGSPTICRSKVTGSPAISRSKVKGSPADFEVIPAPDSLAALKCSTPVRDAQTPVCMSANTTINLTPVTPHTEHNQVIKSSLKKRKSTLTDTKAKKKIKFETNINTNDNMSTIVEEILEEESLIALPDAEPRSHILLNSDIDDIINEKAWLNDKVINFCQNLIKSNGNVNGMQDTLYAPSFDDSKQKWKVNEKFKKQSAPCCQIHFNGNGHWVASYQKEVNGTVYVLDSLKSNRTVNANLIIQISQMYKCEANYIDVLVPEVQRQNNSSDCGVFAIAFITELVLNQFEIDISNIRFIGTKMREHLLKCVQDKNIVVFPKVKKMPKMPCKEPKKLKIKLYCSCKMPDIIDDMVQCENKSCGKWYHKKCVSEITNEWLCNSCSW